MQTSLVRTAWRAVREEIERHYGVLWNSPELPCMEYGAAKALCAWLEGHGFSVERGVNGIPTAFIARKYLGPGPCIGILAEYDALPGLANACSAQRAPLPQEAGHACGHNQIGPTNAGAAIAAADAAQRAGLGGEIRVIGCPAEEILWGKVALFHTGAFAGCDALLTSHGDYQNGAISRPCQSAATGEFVFLGESSHGGFNGKINALEGAEDAIVALRELGRRYADTPLKHVIRGNMHMAGVVPDDVRLYFTLRHPDVARAQEVYDAVIDLCRSVAERAGLAWRHLPIASCRGYLPNAALGQVLFDGLRTVGPPRWDDADLAWMESLSTACAPGQAMQLDRGLALYDEGQDYFCQDDGEVSWRIPLGRVNWAFPQQVPIHHWGWTALTGHQAGRAGALMASEALAIACVRLLAQPALVAQAKDELTRRVGGRELSPPRLGAWRTLTGNPRSFWDATWTEGESSADGGAAGSAIDGATISGTAINK